MSSSFEEKFEQAVKDGVFPGAILIAKDKSGKDPFLDFSSRRETQKSNTEH
jgi:hypothetical protein